MRRMLARSVVFLAFGLAGLLFGAVPSEGDLVWRVSSPEPRLVLVQVDFTPAERHSFATVLGLARRLAPRRTPEFEARLTQSRRDEWERSLADLSGWRVSGRGLARLGYWKSPVGQARNVDGDGRLVPFMGSECVHHVFLELTRPLEPDETVEIATPLGKALSFTRDASVPTPFIKVNQVGYAASATRRYAYLGGWLGTAGSWIPPAAARTFELVSAADGRVLKAGACVPRPADGRTDEGTPWTGETTYEMDLSGAFPDGFCFLRVPGVGRSADFRISDAGLRDALALHLHGLLVQRCGTSVKCEPRTAWGDAPCHLRVWRGTFPPDEGDYAGNPAAGGCFRDASGKPVKVSPFDVISRNTDWSAKPEPLPGGWHDAADYDRRPQHLSVVSDLAAVWLKGRRDPDDPILKEAAWGLEHLRRAQGPDGGVGTWIETVRHPHEGEGMPSKDELRYAVSRPTRAGTLAYAAAAAELARCTPELKTRFLGSAVRAFRWARQSAPATNVPFRVSCDGGEKTVYWQEAATLPLRDQLKVAVNLLAATDQVGWLDDVLSDGFYERFDEEMKRSAWRWSPLVLQELFCTAEPRLEPFRARVRRWVKANADKILSAQDLQPYRFPRWNGKDLGWGNAQPLVQARWLVAAHVATGDARYLDGAWLAQDYHCACNPDGMTLTSGLGAVCPVRFLSLQSTADDVAEYVAGITPYRWTYGVGRGDARYVHTPEEIRQWPIWRRRVILEALSVAASEYTVWETVGPAAAVTAYLVSRTPAIPSAPSPIRPRGRPEDLPGYWALP